MRKISHLVAGLWLLLAAIANAQYRCEIKASQFDAAHSERIFSSVAFCGDTGIASLDLSAAQGADVRLLFMRTVDGGKHWTTQDPGLAPRWTEYFQIRKVKQITGLIAVAVGDTGLVVRTTDGGSTWQQQSIPSLDSRLYDVSFADMEEGIIVGVDSAPMILVTTDEGLDWRIVSFRPQYLTQCHAYGHGHFSGFAYGSGKIYTTFDYWETVDSTSSMYGDTAFNQSPQRILGGCSFGSGDTIIAFGNNVYQKPQRVSPLIVRSTDHGNSWTEVLSDTSLHYNGAFAMSGVDRSEIVAGCTAAFLRILHSTNNGATWTSDTLLLPEGTDPKDKFSCRGIDLNQSGDVIAEIGMSLTSDLIYGVKSQAFVRSGAWRDTKGFYEVASRSIPKLPHKVASVFNAIGQHYDVPRVNDGLDISSLPSGIYFVFDGESILKFIKE